MGGEEAADNGQTERPASGAAETGGNGQGGHEGGHGGHHDRTKPNEAAFGNRIGGRFAFDALGFEREVDLHDGVFLNDANQQNEANEGIET